MRFSDIILLALNNLRRNTMRTILTTLGVAVGIGSLAAMMSFGQGISGSVAQSIESNDIFTGMTISSREIVTYTSGSKRDIFAGDKRVTPLDDSALNCMKAWQEVAIVFPEVLKPATINLAGRSTTTNLKAVPVEMANFSPFDKISHGRFFSKVDEPKVLISKSLLEQMRIFIEGDNINPELIDGAVVLPEDSIIGAELEIVTKVFDPDKIRLVSTKGSDLPIKNEYSSLKIVGIVENSSFAAGMFSGGVFLPSGAIDFIPCIDIRNIYDIIDGVDGKYGKYNTVHLRVNDHKELKVVKNRLEDMGFKVFSIGDKLDDIEKLFFMLDTILAAIGTIAMLVSALGIVNTLMMSIYERRKEIGIMKSLGGTQIQIRLIFYCEAMIIGLLGGIFGVLGGILASQAASKVANSQVGGLIGCDIEYFEFSWALVLLAVGFSVVVSLAASVYPANKASRIDPLDALRRE
jgi:ABC-type antimicrobial peptide transport system permease subunit